MSTLSSTGNLATTGAIIAEKIPRVKQIYLISDDLVGSLYASTVLASCQKEGFSCHSFFFPHGESSKNQSTLSDLYQFLAEHRASREDCIVSLGGGVVGDLVGFAAATYLRGVPYVNIPTTLLAQIDSSIGAKVGINTHLGKNMIGSFYPPEIILRDFSVLQTLPQSAWADGLAEMIKCAAIADTSFFDQLHQKNFSEHLTSFIERAIAIKTKLVTEDPREQNHRKLLNFGHTVGHALETALSYQGITHGQAVAVGMSHICKLAELQGLSPSGTQEELSALLTLHGLPWALPLPCEGWLPFIAQDKKRSGSFLPIVLLKKLGEGYLYPLSLKDSRSFWLGRAE